MPPRPLSSLALILLCAVSAHADKPRTLAISASVANATVLYLTDGSAWEVRNENRELAAKWPPKTAVAVYKTNDSAWPYRLILRPGKADGDVVSAKRLTRIR